MVAQNKMCAKSTLWLISCRKIRLGQCAVLTSLAELFNSGKSGSVMTIATAEKLDRNEGKWR